MSNICIVSRSITGGGSERVFSLLASCLANSLSDNVYIITAKARDKEYLLDDKVIRIQDLNGSDIIADSICINRIVNKCGIDVLIGAGFYCNICCCMTRLLGGKAKIIISERNAPRQDFISIKGRIAKRVMYQLADTIVFQTILAQQNYPSKLQKKGVVICNPIVNDLPERDPQTNTIVAVGRLHKQKNYKMLIDAFDVVFNSHPEYKLIIYGDGNEKEKLVEYVRSRACAKNVIFEGFCKDVHERIKNAKIYVLTSLFEGMPNALMEAMAMGFPVVSTDCPCGGPRTLIEHGCNGLLVAIDDTNGLSEAIEKLIDDDDYRERLGKKAMSIRQMYDLDVISKQWRKVIDCL